MIERNSIGLTFINKEKVIHRLCDDLPNNITTRKIETFAGEIGAALIWLRATNTELWLQIL